MRSIQSERDLFNNPLHEPVFYVRYFRRWVEEALAERDALQGFHEQALKTLGLMK